MLRTGITTAILILLAAVACCGARHARAAEVLALPGGPEVILDRVPGSGSVLAAVAVEAGSALETPRMRGVTHLLEHLLFKGSERYSREEISLWVEESGSFLNAFTRRETTVFFLLARRDLLEESLEILSQMLLHPLFPPRELEKERAVVLEEISLALGSAGGRRALVADRCLYRGSRLAEPVLGYPATIEAITRDEIIAYHADRYVPRRMRILLMGGFEREAALGWIEDYFTCAERPARRAPDGHEPRWSGEVALKPAGGEPQRLELLIRMPRVEERLFPAALLLARLLGGEDTPLAAAAGARGLAPPTAELEAHRSFCALRLVFEQDRAGGGDPAAMLPAVAQLADWAPGAEALAVARTAHAAALIFDRERYHYFVMRHGEAIALSGRRYLEALDQAGQVTGRDIERLLREYFGNMQFNGVHFSGEAQPPLVPERGAALSALPAGPALGAVARAGSPAAALTILFPARGCAGGVAPFAAALLHGVLTHGEGGADLSRRLAALGARVAWDDNPFVPMDDYLVNPSFSFVTLEAPAEHLEQAASALVDFLASFRITETELAASAAAVAREADARSGSPGRVIRDAVYARLFPGHPYGGALVPAVPLPASDAQPLEAARAALHGGGGAAAALVSPLAQGEGLALLERVMQGFPPGERPECPRPQRYEDGIFDGESGRAGALLAAAWRIDNPDPRSAAALAVACEVLSRRMQGRIRETLGLAYSTGCALETIQGAAVAVASLATRGENLEQAFTALRGEVEDLAGRPPGAAEIAAARSRLVSRLLRRRLSSAGESFALAADLVLRGGRCEAQLAARAADAEIAAAAGLLAPGRAVYLRLSPGAGEDEKTSVPRGMMGR